jgi:cytochrome c-type biogenesis protein CcmH
MFCRLLNNIWRQTQSIVCLCLIVLFLVPVARADMRIDDITKDLRCLTCPNESVAESTSPMALDVKDYIRTRLAEDIPEKQIIAELTARYGEELRYKPVLATHTIALWFAPLLILVFGAFLIGRVFKAGSGTQERT